MRDKEMLELAAKAAGIIGKYADDYSYDYYYQGKKSGILYEHDHGGWHVWNPLTDDCDALRLAVKLDLNVIQAIFYREAQVAGALEKTIFEKWRGNKQSATRRAIVRAAAEIGKTL